jgi:hypothetical protein
VVGSEATTRTTRYGGKIFKKKHSERQIQSDNGNVRVAMVNLNLALKYKQSRSSVLEVDIVAIIVKW